MLLTLRTTHVPATDLGFQPVGEEDPQVGAPTRMGVFSR